MRKRSWFGCKFTCESFSVVLTVHSCSHFAASLSHPYAALRRGIKFADNSCCWRCSVPADWCPFYVRKEQCTRQDCILPLCFMMWNNVIWKDLIVRMAGREFDTM